MGIVKMKMRRPRWKTTSCFTRTSGFYDSWWRHGT